MASKSTGRGKRVRSRKDPKGCHVPCVTQVMVIDVRWSLPFIILSLNCDGEAREPSGNGRREGTVECAETRPSPIAATRVAKRRRRASIIDRNDRLNCGDRNTLCEE